MPTKPITCQRTPGGIRLLAVVSAACLLIPASGWGAGAKTLADKLRPDAEYGVSFDYQVQDNYQARLKEYAEKGYAPAEAAPVRVPAGNFTKADKTPAAHTEDGRQAVLWEEDNDYLEWTVEVPASGLYCLRLSYKAADDNGADMVRALSIDGAVPFDECANIPLYRRWKDNGKPVVNSIGDEVRPGVVQAMEWTVSPLYDAGGMYDGALRFYLEKGAHTLRLSVVDEPLLLEYLELYAPEEPPAYAAVKADYDAKGYTPAGKGITFEAEGERILFKNNSTLRMTSDGDPKTSPQKTGSVVMNVLGGTAWQSGNSAVTWQVEVPQSGLYRLALRLKQDYCEGLPSYRRIEVDGQVPFKEWESYRFAYDKNWRTEVLADENGTPYYIYLEAGRPHTLTMTVKQGELNTITQILTADSLRLSELLLNITMITGQTPDVNYDYELDKKIPGLLDALDEIAANMRACMTIMEQVSGNRPSKYYQMESMIAQLAALRGDPFTIPRRLDDLNNILTTYGEWVTQFQQHPLLLDTVELVPGDGEVASPRSNVFQRLWVSTVNFFNSFFKDYDSVLGVSAGDYEVHTTIDVWIGRGKDWGMLLKQMADEDFTPKTGIGIRLNILPAGQLGAGSVNAMLLAISSGRAPDVGLATSTNSIGEFALRNAVVDLSGLEGFAEVRERFLPELFIPMTYQDGIYGLPETMKFTALLYRKDILSELGLSLPETWEDLYDKIIPVLYQNNMQFYIPAANQAEVESSFGMFLCQLGGRYYSDDLMNSAFDQPEAYQAFREFTELFTLYGVPVSASFFNRFRTGEIPIGITDFTAYMQLLAAAPELGGKWGVAPIPGHRREDGTIDRTHNGILAESGMILSQSAHPDEAWQFLKWWMSTSVQRQFGSEIEALNGRAARWNTANLEAFGDMAWPRDDLKQIERTFEQVTQIPVVLGGYFAGRHINNAFNRVVISGQNARDSLEESVKDINRELKRRRESSSAR